jgi:hypothetical protein
MEFVPGLKLNEQYFLQVVKPLLNDFDADLAYSACLIGYGSDVLGFDNPTSMDHNWGPRGQIFLSRQDAAKIGEIDLYLRSRLPLEFAGFPTNYSEKGPDGTQHMLPIRDGPVNHLIEFYTYEDYFYEIFGEALEPRSNLDWLKVPEQRLVEVTSGKVFHDGLGRLNTIREKLCYYPREVQLIKLAAYWHWIENEEAFVGRMTEMDDLLGSKLIAARITSTLLKICFVVKGNYIPYSKWFSRGFDELGLAAVKAGAMTVLRADEPKAIETHLAALYLEVLKLQNECGRFPRVEKRIQKYYQRPYQVIRAGEIVEALRTEVTDLALHNLDLMLVAIDNKLDGLDFTNGGLNRIMAGS